MTHIVSVLGCAYLQLYDQNFVSVLPYQRKQIGGGKPDGCRVFVGVDADRCKVGNVAIQNEGHAAQVIIEQTQRGNGTALQTQNVLQIVFRGKAERTGVEHGSQFLQVYRFVLADRHKVIVSLLVIPKKQIFGNGLGTVKPVALDIFNGVRGGMLLLTKGDAVNGPLITLFGKLLDRRFAFRDKHPWRSFFE